MAEPVEPPPLFDSVDISQPAEPDDLFVSAVQYPPNDDNRPEQRQQDDEMLNGSIAGLSKITLADSPPPAARDDLETVPIASSEPTPKQQDGDYLTVAITEPQKVGDGMGAYLAYRITTRTNMPLFKKREFSVTRRFSDFLGLHDKLTDKYLKMGRIIPPAPEKSVIGTTKIKMADGNGGASGGHFVERRRLALERYLARTAQHPVLVVDPDFREFLEDDVELPKATNTSALSGAGVMRLFNRVGETVNKITYKMDETDPWFEKTLGNVEALDAQLRKLHANVEQMVAHRKDLAALTNGVSRCAAQLSACEDHNSLSRALSQLADTEERVEQLHLDQANTDFFILCEILKDYLGLLGAVRDAFHERTKLFQHWQHSQQMLAKKRELKAKLEMGRGQPDKVEGAAAEVAEWEAKVERSQESFDKISVMIKREMERFERGRLQDFKEMFVKYLENHLNHQGRLVQYWEAFLPDAKAIA